MSQEGLRIIAIQNKYHRYNLLGHVTFNTTGNKTRDSSMRDFRPTYDKERDAY